MQEGNPQRLREAVFRGIVSKRGGCQIFPLLQTTGWKHKHVSILFYLELLMILSLVSSASSDPETGRRRSREATCRARCERVREQAAANKGLRISRMLLKTHLEYCLLSCFPSPDFLQDSSSCTHMLCQTMTHEFLYLHESDAATTKPAVKSRKTLASVGSLWHC